MIKPSPYEIRCSDCGWSKTFSPLSDVLIPGKDYIESCPKCSSSKITFHKAGYFESSLAAINALFRKSAMRRK